MSCEYLWAFNTQIWQPSKRQLLFMLSSVCQEEADRINQYRFKNDFKLCLVGRLMIRKCIQMATKITWKDIKLGRSSRGKPELHNKLSNLENFYFNISHQGDYTVLAASTKANVGIDIMKFSKPNNTDICSFFKLMKRQFIDAEWRYIMSNETERKQLKAFYRLWCLKESYVKAIGSGVGTNTASYMNFQISEKEKDMDNINRIFSDSILYINNRKMPWQFSEYLLGDEHIATVAIENRMAIQDYYMPSEFRILTVDELIQDAEELYPSKDCWWKHFEDKEERK